MKYFLIAGIAIFVVAATPVIAADGVVSVRVGQPGFYGRLDIGDYPPPQVIYRQPIVVEREVEGPPIYLRVPPGHAKHWRQHCREYDACGERVYFVQDNWYQRQYVPAYQQRHREYREDRRDEGSDERHNERGDHNRGHGRNKHRGDDHDNGRDRD